MFRLLLAVLFILGIIWHWGSIKTYLPDKATKNIEKHTDGQYISENILPENSKEFTRLFYFDKEIRKKMTQPGWVKISDIPISMQQAIISVEDNRFYQHGTFDINGILRAILVNIQAGEIVEGGSTITQQVAKNLFLNQEKTMNRKLHEATYAILIENNFSKEEILEIYLNTIYFGSGAYGINQASKTYFNKSPYQLTLAESTMLAGLPAAPSVYSPLENPAAAKKRQAIVLETMVKNSFIGPQKAKEIMQEKLF